MSDQLKKLLAEQEQMQQDLNLGAPLSPQHLDSSSSSSNPLMSSLPPVSLKTSPCVAPCDAKPSLKIGASTVAALLLLENGNQNSVCRQDVAMSIFLYRCLALMAIIGDSKEDPHCLYEKVKGFSGGSSSTSTYLVKPTHHSSSSDLRYVVKEFNSHSPPFRNSGRLPAWGKGSAWLSTQESIRQLAFCDHVGIVRHVYSHAAGPPLPFLMRQNDEAACSVETQSEEVFLSRKTNDQLTNITTHNNAATVVDVEQVSVLSNRCPYVEDGRGASFFLVMEYADGGDLFKQVKARQAGHRYFKPQEVSIVFSQIALALEYIHRHGMVHYDFTIQNVLLTRKGLVKIGDFGFSPTRAGDEGTSTTPYQRCPEFWKVVGTFDQAHGRPTTAQNMWELGVILYQLLTLKRPFEGKHICELIENIRNAKYDLTLPDTFDDCDIPFKEILSCLLVVDPASRSTIKGLIEMPGVQEMLHVYEKCGRAEGVKEHVQASLRR